MPWPNEAQAARLTSKGEGDEPDHLVQGNAPVHHRAGAVQGHVGVHVLVHQPESNGFVPHQSLHKQAGYCQITRTAQKRFSTWTLHWSVLELQRSACS